MLPFEWNLILIAWINFSSVDAKPQCVTDSDCDIDKQCYQGSCRFACSVVTCGLNAACVPQYHNGVCQCLRGYEGNPQIACTKGIQTSLLVSKYNFLMNVY